MIRCTTVVVQQSQVEQFLIQARQTLVIDCWCPLTTTAANWPKDARVYLLILVAVAGLHQMVDQRPNVFAAVYTPRVTQDLDRRPRFDVDIPSLFPSEKGFVWWVWPSDEVRNGRSRTREVVDSMNVKRTFVVSQGRRPREDKKVTGLEKGQVSDGRGLCCDNYHSTCQLNECSFEERKKFPIIWPDFLML